jgi:hypothetical protein
MHAGKALFEAFIVPAKRRRYIELLDARGGRKKILRSLDHFKYLDPRFCRKVKAADALRILKSLGAPAMCHVISSNDELDGREIDLAEALKEIIGRDFGSFICHRERSATQ